MYPVSNPQVPSGETLRPVEVALAVVPVLVALVSVAVAPVVAVAALVSRTMLVLKPDVGSAEFALTRHTR